MKRTTLLLKSLLLAVGLLAGSNVWAYDVPEGMEVKEVLIGTLSEGNVAAESFESDGAVVPSFTNKSNFLITDVLPTDIWNSLALRMSGNVLRLGSRTTHEIDFSSTVKKGQVVFSTNMYVGTHAKIIKFIDEDNNVVARFQYSDKSTTNGRVYGQQYLFVDIDEDATFSSTPALNDTYQGTRNREYEISEFVIDLDKGIITYSGKVMDRRSSSNKWCDDNATITLSKDVNIKGIVIDASGVGSSTYYAYFDNMKLFSVGALSGSHAYTIKAVCGNEELQTLGSGYVKQDASYGVTGIPEVIVKEGKYYVLDSTIENHTVSYTMGDADEVKEINYTLNNNIVYFGEWETAYSTTSSNYKVHNVETFSGGQGRTINRTDITMQLSFIVPADGKYLIDIPYYNNSDKGREHIIYLDEAVDGNILEQKTIAKSTSGILSEELELEAGTHSIIVKCTYNTISVMDYLKVEAKSLAQPISSAGWATLYTPYALDFAKTEGLTAYTATVDGMTVTLKGVPSVPANTGVVLKGAEGIYNIPVIPSSDTTEKGDLKGNATAATTYDADYSRYYLAMNTEDKAQFKKLNEGGTIAAGKAYLEIDPTVTARALNVVFAGETTAIDAIANVKEQNGEVYNLAGQRVAKPAKGLYIVSGKKVMFK